MRSKWTLAGSSACILASSPSSTATTASCVSSHPPLFFFAPLFWPLALLRACLHLLVRETISSWSFLYTSYHPDSHLRPTLMRRGAMGFAGLAPRISKQMRQDATHLRHPENYLSLRRFVASLAHTHMFAVIRNSLNLRSRCYIPMLM